MLAVGTVVVAGLWGARVSWQSRLGFAHIVALGTILWGLALTGQEVLPRVGYARARAVWRCVKGQAGAPTATSLSMLKQRIDAGMADLLRELALDVRAGCPLTRASSDRVRHEPHRRRNSIPPRSRRAPRPARRRSRAPAADSRGPR